MMKPNQFVQQLNYPSRKIDGNFILANDVETVLEYIAERQAIVNDQEVKRQEIIAKNKEATDNLLSYLLDELKIDQWKIFKKKKSGRGWTATTVRGDMYAHWKKAFEDVKTYVPLRMPNVANYGADSAQYELIYNNVSLTLRFNKPHTMKDIFEQSKLAIKQHEESIAKENKLLMISKKFLDERNQDYSELITGKDIIKLADEIAREEYHEAQYGEEIDVIHSDGDDCTWSVGERRCECGNNRYYLEIDGDLINGYYSYGQWH